MKKRNKIILISLVSVLLAIIGVTFLINNNGFVKCVDGRGSYYYFDGKHALDIVERKVDLSSVALARVDVNSCLGIYKFSLKEDGKWNKKVIRRKLFESGDHFASRKNDYFLNFDKNLNEYNKNLCQESVPGKGGNAPSGMPTCLKDNFPDEYNRVFNIKEDIEIEDGILDEDLYIESYSTGNENEYINIDKQILINFLDSYKIYNDRQIGFGPLSPNLGPDPSDKSLSYNFQLEIEDYRSAKDIIKNFKDYNKNLTIEPFVLKVGDFEVIKYAEGGMCEKRAMKVIGKRFNYDFSSDGCVNDQETDFNYLIKTIEEMKIMESEEPDSSTNAVYENGNLGLKINYYSNPEWPTLVKEVGNKVYFYDKIDGDNYEMGQYIEKFDKDKDISFADAIKNELLGEDTGDYCFVRITGDLGDMQYATIDYPNNLCEDNEPSWVCANCTSYQKTNGAQKFIYDKNHPDVYFFVSIGQASLLRHIDGLTGEEMSKLEWFNNIEVIDQSAESNTWEGWLNYYDKDYGFEFEYPQNIEVDKGENRTLFKIGDAKGGYFLLSVKDNTDKKNAIEIKNDYYNNDAYGYQYEDSYLDIGGVTSYKQGRYDLGVIENYFIPKDDKIIYFNFEFNFEASDDSIKNDKKELIKDILSTFKL